MMEDLLTINQLAKIIPFAPWSIRKMCRERRIPYFRLGGRYLFKKSSISQWISKSEKKVVRANVI